jgi:L-threonylcarbamoyladenylate synthase
LIPGVWAGGGEIRLATRQYVLSGRQSNANSQLPQYRDFYMALGPQPDFQTVAMEPERLREAGERIRSGGIVAFPTETVYGLGANALDPEAVAKIFAIKGRPSTNPLIVHVADSASARTLVSDWPELAEQLAQAFWPGPLTIVCRKSAAIPDLVSAGGSTVAIRCPADPIALAFIREAGVPIAAPSANKSGELSPTTAEHVIQSLGQSIDFILDGGPCSGGLESTVVDVTGSTVRLLRPGLITRTELEARCGPIQLGPANTPDGPAPSPGMQTRHYAPKTALECAATPEETDFLVNLYETAGLKVVRYSPGDDPISTACELYAKLHSLDRAGYDRIIATLPPHHEQWRAIRDRLIRASAEE